MNKRDIILFGVGFFVGYLIIKSTKTKVVLSGESEFTPDFEFEEVEPQAGTTQIQEPEVVETIEDPKITYCKDRWIQFASTRKFSSPEQEQMTYDNFMAGCVMQS